MDRDRSSFLRWPTIDAFYADQRDVRAHGFLDATVSAVGAVTAWWHWTLRLETAAQDAFEEPFREFSEGSFESDVEDGGDAVAEGHVTQE